MVKNDFSWDLATICHNEKISQSELAREMGMTRNAVNKRGKGYVVTPGFVKVLDKLGYDIEVRYIKRDENIHSNTD